MRLDGKVTARRRFTVSPGPHILDVAESGYLSRTDSVRVAAGQQFVWTPKLVAAPQAKGAVAPPPAAEAAAKRGNGDENTCRQSVAASAWHEAFPPCMRAADAGSAIAQRNVALMFQHGEGASRSDDNAAHWFAEAAHGGDAESMYQLALAYERGRGVKKDQAAALDWYTRAGNAGHADASYAVGDAYEKGRLGMGKDKAKAIEWYRKAAAQGNKDAASKVRDLSR
jgi:TPR repeat protein